jgi:hypothetical protein
MKTRTLRALKIAGATLLAAPLLASLAPLRAQDAAPMNDATNEGFCSFVWWTST